MSNKGCCSVERASPLRIVSLISGDLDARDLCLVGHHHQHAESTFGATSVVALASVWERYYTLDPDTLALDRHRMPA